MNHRLNTYAAPLQKKYIGENSSTNSQEKPTEALVFKIASSTLTQNPSKCMPIKSISKTV